MDLKIDDLTGDLSFDASGQLEQVTGADAIKQHVQTRLRWFFGEWFLDERIGVPYLQRILGKPANFSLAAAIIRETVLGTPGVERITSFSIGYEDATKRLARADFRVISTEGPINFRELIGG